jgi:hypothetical protein
VIGRIEVVGRHYLQEQAVGHRPVATGSLGLIKRGVGSPQRAIRLFFLCVGLYYGGTDADRDRDVCDQCAGDAAAQSFGDPVSRVEVGFRYHDGEFFAAHAGH